MKKKEKKLQSSFNLLGVNTDKVFEMETVFLVGQLAFSCLGLYNVQTAHNEELMGFNARKEELATMQEDLIKQRDQWVAIEMFCAAVSSSRKKIE